MSNHERTTGASSVGGDHRHDHPHDTTHDTGHENTRSHVATHSDQDARDQFGGFNWGACFFGWLVAVGVSILLSSIIGAVVSGVSSTVDVSQSEAERQSGTIGIVAAAVLLVVLLLGYYAGGYVAGRMSRFDGGRQGVGVWVIGLVVTIIAAVLGFVFGSQYNILNRVDLPNLPVTESEASIGAIITGVAVLLGTLLAAFLGGKVGHRYHDRVDRAAGRTLTR
jgi:MFS family permease